MPWMVGDQLHNLCHSEPGAKPGEACPERRRREPVFKIAPKTRILVVLVSFISILFCPAPAAAQTPEALLAAGRVDQAMQTLEQQISTAPTAEAYNLLCRAHFE